MAKITSVAADGKDGVVIAGTLRSGSNPWSVFVARVSSSGEVTEQRTLGAGDGVRAIHRTEDAGFVVVTEDDNVIQVDRTGQIRWQQKIVGADTAVALRDGSVVVAHLPEDRRVEAVVVTRLNARGEKAWERTNQGVCRTSGMWLRSDDEIIVVSEPCDDSGPSRAIGSE
jgi:translation initiation factor IF-1